jgi:hypothetical protein
MHNTTFIKSRCALLVLLSLGLNASAQFPWLNKMRSGGCCPGCGSADDPLGPRYRSEPITSTVGTNSNITPSTIGALSRPNQAVSNSNAVSVTSSNSPAQPTSAPPEIIVSGGEKYLLISFTQLASFALRTAPKMASENPDSMVGETQVREQVPDAVKSLSEKSVAVTGFMLPVRTQGELTTDFLLLRNQSACCYGVMPKINEWVAVRTAGKGVKVFLDTPVTVLGTFHVGASGTSGSLTSIYQLNCDRLINPTKYTYAKTYSHLYHSNHITRVADSRADPRPNPWRCN